jgi:hypothetical protein
VSFLRSKRGVAILCAVLVLAMFLVRPGASHLKARIANSIGTALQRRVEIGSVHLRLLPRPGFELQDFVVHEDPAFGAEPVLRAQEVSASLRLLSLMRGRIEIAQLSLTEPSLNLMRNSDGRWNIENLLERTSMTAVAPTAKARYESRPAFPYIEADRGRINFKLGPEKKPFAFTEADYSFWQDSENTWGMRLKARPMRTDFNLSDTGQFKVIGTWRRATSLRETPLQFSMQWDGAQLGQATKLFSGQDKGWRGTITVSADLTGTPADLIVRSDGSLDDFRRYDILGGGVLSLHTHCEAHYSTIDRGLRQIFCQTPTGDGAIALLGDVLNVPGPRQYDLKLAADRLPVQSVLALVRHAKRDIPDDLVARGTVVVDFNLRGSRESGHTMDVAGNGKTSDLLLRSNLTRTELTLGAIPFSVLDSDETPGKNIHKPHGPLPATPSLAFGPFSVKLGRTTPATVQAWLNRSGYDISVDGEADLQRLLQVGRTFGIPATNSPAEGSAKLALHVAGQWAGFSGPKATGTALLHGVRTDVRGLDSPVEISSANVVLGEDGIKVDSVSATAGGSRWTGSVSLPRMCSAMASCPVEFTLHADEISAGALRAVFSPKLLKKKWYRFLSADTPAGPSFLSRIKASGKLSANQVVLGSVVASRVTATAKLDQGRLDLSNLRGNIWGGKQVGDLHADFTVKPPKYTSAGVLQGISLAQLADTMHDGWISGTANAQYKIEVAGRGHGDQNQATSGTVEFTMQDGHLPRIAIANGPLKVRRFTGILTVDNGQLELSNGILQSPTATFVVSGTASMTRDLDFKMAQEGSPSITVTGTVADPHVEFAHHSETHAELKP